MKVSGPHSLALTIIVFALSILAFPHASAALIQNGDFQAGNTGFSSDYTYATSGSVFQNDSTYAIVANPASVHGMATSFFDHTYGNAQGLMMAVNGSTHSGSLVWGETVTGLTIGRQYRFSLWMASWFPQSVAQIDIRIGGASRATFYAPEVTGLWEERSFTWTALSDTIAFTAIYDINTAWMGNDFVLDDISMVAFDGKEDDQCGQDHHVPETPSVFVASAIVLVPFGLKRIRVLRR